MAVAKDYLNDQLICHSFSSSSLVQKMSENVDKYFLNNTKIFSLLSDRTKEKSLRS